MFRVNIAQKVNLNRNCNICSKKITIQSKIVQSYHFPSTNYECSIYFQLPMWKWKHPMHKADCERHFACACEPNGNVSSSLTLIVFTFKCHLMECRWWTTRLHWDSVRNNNFVFVVKCSVAQLTNKDYWGGTTELKTWGILRNDGSEQKLWCKLCYRLGL